MVGGPSKICTACFNTLELNFYGLNNCSSFLLRQKTAKTIGSYFVV